MEKVKTFAENLKEGYRKTFNSLDKRVEELGKIEIKDIKDTVYPQGSSLGKNNLSYIERIVIYQEKDKKIEGEPWKPTLDTDLMEFLEISYPPQGVVNMVEKAYNKEKKTIRDLIAMPYGWFVSIEARESYRGGKENWDLLKGELNRYGFKFHKKGFVVKD